MSSFDFSQESDPEPSIDDIRAYEEGLSADEKTIKQYLEKIENYEGVGAGESRVRNMLKASLTTARGYDMRNGTNWTDQLSRVSYTSGRQSMKEGAARYIAAYEVDDMLYDNLVGWHNLTADQNNELLEAWRAEETLDISLGTNIEILDLYLKDELSNVPDALFARCTTYIYLMNRMATFWEDRLGVDLGDSDIAARYTEYMRDYLISSNEELDLGAPEEKTKIDVALDMIGRRADSQGEYLLKNPPIPPDFWMRENAPEFEEYLFQGADY